MQMQNVDKEETENISKILFKTIYPTATNDSNQ